MPDDTSPDTRSLSGCVLFREVDPDRIPRILESAGASVETHRSGTLVRLQGSRYQSLILLAEGALEARFESLSGKGMAVEHFTAPSAVATAVLMSSDPVLPVSLVAEKDSVLITIEYRKVLDIFASEPAILKAYLADAGDKVRFLAEKIRLFRFASLRSKIASHLLFLSREQSTSSPAWRYGREQMADLLGVARPSLSRELSRMADDGLIELPDRQRVVLDAEALELLLEED